MTPLAFNVVETSLPAGTIAAYRSSRARTGRRRFLILFYRSN